MMRTWLETLAILMLAMTLAAFVFTLIMSIRGEL